MPQCPKCGGDMMKRVAKQGKNTGFPFWGCKKYPECKGTVDIDANGNEVLKQSYDKDRERYYNSFASDDDGHG